jgi:hypothetical protein
VGSAPYGKTRSGDVVSKASARTSDWRERAPDNAFGIGAAAWLPRINGMSRKSSGAEPLGSGDDKRLLKRRCDRGLSLSYMNAGSGRNLSWAADTKSA